MTLKESIQLLLLLLSSVAVTIAFSALTLPSVHTVDWTLGTASGLKKK